MERIEREKLVVRCMIAMYCSRFHRFDGRRDVLCDECRTLFDYACARIDMCPKRGDKSSCRKCEIHCYSQSRRDDIRRVMRYAGPRMLFIHPAMAIRHLIDECRH
ncbi:nitrous oxide-stimulated promoter family protein [uncultured Muribaculum sp.]|uniref:nitrous oxide-stimulated promoter family protein n=1 Tax=uncultured Muribaculum sp. TaxID=1918613 RepID=UPI0025F178EC|nr:nitrous oxide-stimulated promoter family protein [uncultured Muribaculum sp.]